VCCEAAQRAVVGSHLVPVPDPEDDDEDEDTDAGEAVCEEEDEDDDVASLSTDGSFCSFLVECSRASRTVASGDVLRIVAGDGGEGDKTEDCSFVFAAAAGEGVGVGLLSGY